MDNLAKFFDKMIPSKKLNRSIERALSTTNYENLRMNDEGDIEFYEDGVKMILDPATGDVYGDPKSYTEREGST